MGRLSKYLMVGMMSFSGTLYFETNYNTLCSYVMGIQKVKVF